MISDLLKEKVPNIRVGILVAEIEQNHNQDALTYAMTNRLLELSQSLKTEEISKIDGIKWGRSAYRKLGKDPTRYRLSSEKLLRRISKGEGLSRVNPVVDLMNWISLETHSPIGVFDYNKLVPPFMIDYGRTSETYMCLAGYELSLEGLMLIRDSKGPFGSTTSDAVIAPVTNSTEKILVVIYVLDPKQDIEEDLIMISSMIKTYLGSQIITVDILG